MNISINDIAKKAGVSTATVSRAFSENNYVNENTKKRILDIAKELNYTPKIYQKNTAKSAYRSTIGVILPYINNNFYYEIIKGIEDTFNKYDIDVILCCTFGDSKKELMYIDLFNRIKLNGFIIVPNSEKSDANKSYLTNLASQTNIVLLDREFKGENLDGVFMNNYASAYQGTKLLIDEGHKNIAFICGSLDSTSGFERLRGYRQALEDSGIEYDVENVLFADFDYQKAYEKTKEFIKSKLRVSAIFSSSSMMAMGSMLALAEKGLTIPNDIGFLTYGYSEWKNKNISFLKYPAEEMGIECARLILERLNSLGKKRKSPKKRSVFEVSIESYGSEKYFK